jgi:hypothetical protein|eukprot:COSAG03_NODE_19_length_21645_cov_17.937532_18_plen_111_part_00
MKLSQMDVTAKELLVALGYTNRQWDNADNRNKLTGYITVTVTQTDYVIWAALTAANGITHLQDAIVRAGADAGIETHVHASTMDHQPCFQPGGRDKTKRQGTELMRGDSP